MSGSGRWRGLGSGWRDGAVAYTANDLLGLGTVITSILLGGRGNTSGMLTRKRLDLVGLFVGNVGNLGEVVIDKLLVGLVDQWGEEKDGIGEQDQTPEWNDLDEVVREESSQEGLISRSSV